MLPLSSILGKINPLDKDNASADEFCLGLVINEKKVKSAIWNLSSAGKESLTFGSSEGWGNESAEELIVAADASIANAITKSPHLGGRQPTKVVLGLPEQWVEGNTVNQKKSLLLQNICRKLLLKSLGFVVTPEAIAHFLKEEEGGSPSVVLVNLSETEIIVSLIAQGKFIGSKVVGRSDNLALDLEEGLLRFDYQGVLPHRILLIEDADLSGDIEELKQVLVAYPWVGPEGGKKLNFLQLPKVEVAEPDFEVRAVVIAGKHELGLETKKDLSPAKEAVEPEKTVEEAIIESKETVEEDLPEEDFGFVKETDIALSAPLPEKEPEKEAIKETALVEEKFSPPPQRTRKIASLLPKLKLPHLKLPQPAWHFAFSKAFLLVPLGLVLILGMGFLSFYGLAKAEVKVLVQPKKIDKEFEFSVAKTGEVDSEKMAVPAREMSVEVLGSKTTAVNGKKTVGEKASGEVVIYNKTFQAKTLPKGLVLGGPGALKFTLADEVKIASMSPDLAFGGYKWGETKVKVTAADIGAQYNLAANSNFTLETLSSSSFSAKNPATFSGGTSREIQAVSKEDRENLRLALLAELEKKAKDEIGAKLSPNDYLLADSLQLKNEVDHFNHEVGDEATDLSLEKKAVFSTLFLKDEDFRILADKTISPLIPEGYRKEALKEGRTLSANDKVKGAYTARVEGEYLPAFSLEEIPNQLKGKTFTAGERYLRSLGEMSGLQIVIKPKPFSLLKIFPLKGQNITVTMETL